MKTTLRGLFFATLLSVCMKVAVGGPCASYYACWNGGTCSESADGRSYSCRCRPGFTGNKCETNKDDCAGAPCLNGAYCSDGVASFSCACSPGFTGLVCEQNINDCLTDSICQNGGTCIDGIAKYHCLCASGYTGKNCTEVGLTLPYPVDVLLRGQCRANYQRWGECDLNYTLARGNDPECSKLVVREQAIQCFVRATNDCMPREWRPLFLNGTLDRVASEYKCKMRAKIKETCYDSNSDYKKCKAEAATAYTTGDNSSLEGKVCRWFYAAESCYGLPTEANCPGHDSAIYVKYFSMTIPPKCVRPTSACLTILGSRLVASAVAVVLTAQFLA